MNIRNPHPDSCEQFRTFKKPNGNYKTERCYSYVGLLCEKGGTETAALRVDYCTNKTEAAEKLKKELAEVAGVWNVKGIWRLYDEDFEDKPEEPVPDSLAAFMNPPERGEKE